jgi:hypothetical protein
MTGSGRGLAPMRGPTLFSRHPFRPKSPEVGAIAPGQSANLEVEGLDAMGIHLGGYLDSARALANLSFIHRALPYFFFLFLTSFFSVIFHCLPAHLLRAACSSLL